MSGTINQALGMSGTGDHMYASATDQNKTHCQAGAVRRGSQKLCMQCVVTPACTLGLQKRAWAATGWRGPAGQQPQAESQQQHDSTLHLDQLTTAIARSVRQMRGGGCGPCAESPENAHNDDAHSIQFTHWGLPYLY